MKKYDLLIRQMPSNDHAIETKISTWKKYETEHPEVWDIINSLFSGQQILKLSRRELKEIANSQNYEKLVVAVILWGYSSGMRGNNFTKIANQIDKIANLLHRASKGIDDWHSHYAEVKEISGLGLSTYSKFIYFVGGKVQGSEPLILDVRVIDAINTGQYREFEGLAKLTYINASTLYPDYLKVVHQFADNSDCLAEQVEMFLFMFGQNLKNIPYAEV